MEGHKAFAAPKNPLSLMTMLSMMMGVTVSYSETETHIYSGNTITMYSYHMIGVSFCDYIEINVINIA